MARIDADGVTIDLPQGWEAQIRRAEDDERAPAAAEGGAAYPRVVLHASNVPLPPERGDFGSNAVEAMGARHVFVSVIEYDRAQAGSALFRREGLPTRLRAADFHPQALQRTLPGQAGSQTFFTQGGRAFCLYVVLGNHRLANVTMPAVNQVLAGVTIAG